MTEGPKEAEVPDIVITNAQLLDPLSNLEILGDQGANLDLGMRYGNIVVD